LLASFPFARIIPFCSHHSLLFVIPFCLSFPFVCHSLLFVIPEGNLLLLFVILSFWSAAKNPSICRPAANRSAEDRNGARSAE